jgi:pantoate--beta-alanine ligase
VQTIRDAVTLRNALEGLRADGPLALVPTMGALHEGHLALVREAKSRAAHTIVSIFVNPLQFGAGEDLDAYPRTAERDSELLRREGVAVLWMPGPTDMYPPGFATRISVGGLTGVLCGRSRPGHFDGVATVVAKLFNQTLPDMAFFGEKDWQQLAVIRQMARDLDLAAPAAEAIHAVPTVREADALAMSSRNAYLSAEERGRAAVLPAAMREALEAFRAGGAVARVLGELKLRLEEAGFEVDYGEFRDGETLEPAQSPAEGARLFVAARIGGTRLIDNMPV